MPRDKAAKPPRSNGILTKAAATEPYIKVSTHESFLMAEIALQQYDEFGYVSNYNYGARGHAKVYRCVEHQLCGKFLRIRDFECLETTKTMYDLEHRGIHTAEVSTRKRRGIHPAFKVEVDTAVLSGGSPTKVMLRLQEKYKDQDLLVYIPSEVQIKNRKAHLTRQLEKQTKITTFAELNEWASLRMCTSRETFFDGQGFDAATDETTFSALPAGHRNGTLVLNTFHHDYQDDNAKKTSFGLIMTSRRIFRNVRYAAEGQQSDGIFAAADGTYKLHFGNWVLVAFGTYRSQYTTASEYSKSFVPFAYMFVRTEHEFAYTQLFATVVNYAKSFFAIELDVTYGSLDHADYIANAYEAVWPGITLLDCYPHVSRKCREKIGLLIPTPAQSAQEYYHGNVEVNIRQMHLARSPEEFDAISSKCLKHWRNDGQRSYADWFKKVYLADRWARWYATSGTPGVVPSQNPLESHNGVVKKCGVNAKRVKTGVMLNDSIPGILNLAARDPPKSPFGHYCAGPIPSDIIAQATKHVVEGAHFRKYKSVNGKRYTRSILFNAIEYMANKTRISGVKVTASRVNRYLNAKQGDVPDNDSVTAINLEYLSLHEVEFLNPEESSDFCLPVQPVISVDKMKEIRSRYRCDCKMFWTTGWICSHVVATMDLAKQFKLEVAMASLPVRKVSGGQRKVPGALYRDAPDNRTFSKPNLLKRLQDQPFYPYGWKIAEDFIFEEDGKEWSEYIIGVIDRHRAVKRGSGVNYEWKVVFCDGDEKYYECEQLVDLLVSSRRGGLDITSSATSDSSNVDTTNSLVSDNHNFGTTTANNITPTELAQ